MARKTDLERTVDSSTKAHQEVLSELDKASAELTKELTEVCWDFLRVESTSRYLVKSMNDSEWKLRNLKR